MKEKVLPILIHLKQNNISAQRIEKDLGFSNGVLGKASKGLANLSEARFSQLGSYYQTKLVELGLVGEQGNLTPKKDPPDGNNEQKNDPPPPPSNDKYDFLNS